MWLKFCMLWCLVVDIVIVYKRPILFLIHYGLFRALCVVVLCVGSNLSRITLKTVWNYLCGYETRDVSEDIYL
jgi:hypothetical protein